MRSPQITANYKDSKASREKKLPAHSRSSCLMLCRSWSLTRLIFFLRTRLLSGETSVLFDSACCFISCSKYFRRSRKESCSCEIELAPACCWRRQRNNQSLLSSLYGSSSVSTQLTSRYKVRSDGTGLFGRMLRHQSFYLAKLCGMGFQKPEPLFQSELYIPLNLMFHISQQRKLRDWPLNEVCSRK